MANKEVKKQSSTEESEHNELKFKIEQVVLECFRKAKQKNFADLNFVFPIDKTESSFIKGKLKIFNKVDVYSQTFLSIFTRAKVALSEFQEQYFEGNYLELLRLVLTLPEVLDNEKLKSIKVSQKEIIESSRNLNNAEVGEVIVTSSLRGNTKLVKQGVTGKTIARKLKDKAKLDFELQSLNDINFQGVDDEHIEDEAELEDDGDNLGDIKF